MSDLPVGWELPSGWVEAQLGDFLLVQRGGSPRPIKSFLTTAQGGLNWIKIGDVLPGSKYITHTKEKILRTGLSKTRQVSKGDLLLSNSMSFGRPYILQIDGCIHDGWLVLRQPWSSNIDKEFLYHWLSTPQVYERLGQIAKGSTVRNLNSEIVRSVQVSIPPLNEQRRIVQAIEALQAKAKAARAALDAIVPLLETFRQSVLAAAFRGDLTREWRAQHPDVEPASVLLKRIHAERRVRWIEAAAEKGRARAQARAAKKGKDWSAADDAAALERERVKAAKKYVAPAPVDAEAAGLPELPAGWCWASLDELAWHFRNGISRRPHGDDGIRILRISAVRPQRLNINDVRYLPDDIAHHDSLLCEGDLLFTRYNGNAELVGACAVVPALPQPTVYPDKLIRARVFTELSLPDFIAAALRQGRSGQFIREHAKTAAGQVGISGRDLKSTPVPLAPLNEQRQICAALNTRTSAALSALEFAQTVADDLPTLNQSILAKAFRGELVPQDPNDEPASVLLERIRKERAAAEASKPKKTRRKRTPKKTAKAPTQDALPGMTSD